jgi:hypothetical protein
MNEISVDRASAPTDATPAECIAALVDAIANQAILIITSSRPGAELRWRAASLFTQVALLPLTNAESELGYINSLLSDHVQADAHAREANALARAAGLASLEGRARFVLAREAFFAADSPTASTTDGRPSRCWPAPASPGGWARHTGWWG